ncbi:MAG: hypothetical protein IJT94_05365 [Oscillibacter sp.]|nr:hypothetical protein [Oscillibacter sp.]
MPDYQKPYHILLDGMERAIKQLDAVNVGAARAILIQAEQDAEEVFLSDGENSQG